jgi:flagellar basal body-associated protein FliL
MFTTVLDCCQPAIQAAKCDASSSTNCKDVLIILIICATVLLIATLYIVLFFVWKRRGMVKPKPDNTGGPQNVKQKKTPEEIERDDRKKAWESIQRERLNFLRDLAYEDLKEKKVKAVGSDEVKKYLEALEKAENELKAPEK